MGWCVVGLLGVVGFVLLARTEPSVVRAATMGTVGLIGMGHHGRRRGTRALGAAVLLLLLFDPWLALSPGFALSALATAGILWLAPGWRDRLMRWLPRWVAEAVAVPLAAQLACTPLVAAISGQVSLVAVRGQPARRPCCRAGHGPRPRRRRSSAWSPCPWVGWSRPRPPGARQWIIAVAVRCADLPVAAVGWSADPVGVAGLTVLCLALSLVPRVRCWRGGPRRWPRRADGRGAARAAADTRAGRRTGG